MRIRFVFLVVMFVFSGLSRAEFSVRVEKFPVFGKTRDQIVASIYGSSNSATLGTTTLEDVRLNSKTLVGQNGKCIFMDASITGSIVVRLPELDGRHEVSPRLSSGFDSYASSVESHEKKHVDIWQTSHADLSNKVSSLNGMECDAAKRRLDVLVEEWRNFWDARQRDLDSREGHVGSDRIKSYLSSEGNWF